MGAATKFSKPNEKRDQIRSTYGLQTLAPHDGQTAKRNETSDAGKSRTRPGQVPCLLLLPLPASN